MPFSIAFEGQPLSYPYDDPTTPAATGVLILGDHRESFLASLYDWSRQDYEKQWRHAIEAVLDAGDKAALITTFVSPQVGTHLEWWPMYLVGNRVFFQDQLLFHEKLSRPFSVESAFLYIRDRETVNEEGQTISEWSVSLTKH